MCDNCGEDHPEFGPYATMNIAVVPKFDPNITYTPENIQEVSANAEPVAVKVTIEGFHDLREAVAALVITATEIGAAVRAGVDPIVGEPPPGYGNRPTEGGEPKVGLDDSTVDQVVAALAKGADFDKFLKDLEGGS